MITPMSNTRAPDAAPRTGPLWEAARALEASFLSQMLTSAGLGTVSEGFGGGIGEDQFASLMANAGGIGLAESIFKSLATRAGDA